MAEVVKSEAYLLSLREYSCLHRRRTKILLHEDRSRQMSTFGDESKTKARSKRNVRTHSERAATASLLILAAGADGGQALLCTPIQRWNERPISVRLLV